MRQPLRDLQPANGRSAAGGSAWPGTPSWLAALPAPAQPRPDVTTTHCAPQSAGSAAVACLPFEHSAVIEVSMLSVAVIAALLNVPEEPQVIAAANCYTRPAFFQQSVYACTPFAATPAGVLAKQRCHASRRLLAGWKYIPGASRSGQCGAQNQQLGLQLLFPPLAACLHHQAARCGAHCLHRLPGLQPRQPRPSPHSSLCQRFYQLAVLGQLTAHQARQQPAKRPCM